MGGGGPTPAPKTTAVSGSTSGVGMIGGPEPGIGAAPGYGVAPGTPPKPGAAPAPGLAGAMPPFMPGLDQMLAQQLSMGFGGAPADFLKQFSSIYSPMQMPTSPVAAPAPAAKATTTKPAGLIDNRASTNRGGSFYRR